MRPVLPGALARIFEVQSVGSLVLPPGYRDPAGHGARRDRDRRILPPAGETGPDAVIFTRDQR